MTFKELCLEIARREAGKKEISIAQIREIAGIVADILSESVDAEVCLMKVADQRRKKRAKKK